MSNYDEAYINPIIDKPGMFQNARYRFDRIQTKTLYLDVFIGTGTAFAVSLLEPLIIDKLSDVFLDTFSFIGTQADFDDAMNRCKYVEN